MRDIPRKLSVARGEMAADLVFRNGRIVNVLSGEIHSGDVAVCDGRIVGIGAYEGRETVDLQGAFLAPAFIDGHIHIESTMLTVPEFARAVVPRGTCAAVVDPHEFANVAGIAGIRYVLDASRDLPIDVFVMASSCVPATPLESSGATIGVDDIASFIGMDRVAGIAEMMNFPGVYLGWESELKKIALGRGLKVDGHSPGLRPPLLDAYILAGVDSDHECTAIEEARDKLRRGMHVLLREGTAERNLLDLLPLVSAANAANFSYATDDKHPADLEDEGHIDHHVREAIAWGLDPILALQLATINPARHYRLRNLGAIAPRYWANLVVFDELSHPHPRLVYYRGTLVAREGKFLASAEADAPLPATRMNVAPFNDDAFAVAADPGKQVKVINIIPRQIVTAASLETPLITDGRAVADPARDILKLAVVERHRGTGNIGIGFVRGFGLARGAIASTVAHDAHNIIVVGCSDADMIAAVRELIRMEGGQCIVDGGDVVARLPLPVCGLVSDRPLEEVRAGVDALIAAAHALGCTLQDPCMTLSFLALSPIPALKVTDLGLVDAERFELTPLFI